MTNVFISWSGDLSKQLAEALRQWIPSVLQFAKPYFTPSDIEKGAKWGSEISQKLSDTHVGIICLTRENYQKPWILFEAGALSKDLEKSRICSVLFGMDNSDLDGPLTTFQTTSFDKADFKKLIQNINDAGGEQKLSRETLEEVFEMWWPRLESKVKAIMSSEGNEKKSELRSDRELLEEVLSLSRLSASRTRTSLPKISTGALIHILKTGMRLLDEAMNYKDKDILMAVDEIADAVEHIANRSGDQSEISNIIEELRSKIRTTSVRIESSSETDDEIPF